MSLAPGTTLGPYQIVSQLGSGGMGVVHRATDPRLDRSDAIKLNPEYVASDLLTWSRGCTVLRESTYAHGTL